MHNTRFIHHEHNYILIFTSWIRILSLYHPQFGMNNWTIPKTIGVLKFFKWMIAILNQSSTIVMQISQASNMCLWQAPFERSDLAKAWFLTKCPALHSLFQFRTTYHYSICPTLLVLFSNLVCPKMYVTYEKSKHNIWTIPNLTLLSCYYHTWNWRITGLCLK